jgi:hypothetical protein
MAKKRKLKVPDDALRLPGPDDPLTTEEQNDLFRQLDKGALRISLLSGELQNIHRMRATLLFYRGLLPEEGVDELLPERRLRNGIDYLWERKCRVCGCTSLQACEGGCWWVESDLCSGCEVAFERLCETKGKS